MTEIRDLSKQWAEWDILSSLGNYQSVVNILFGYLNNKTSSKAGHPVRTQISEQLSQDVCAVQRQLVCLLRDEQTYRRFLACHGNLAQQLLDLIQDILDSTCQSTSRPLLSKALIRLSRTSGLHPTCFALSGLEKVGQQVAAGGFGDICKGLVGHQSVAVKMMRLFRDADMQAALKDFGREALIWRQLSHPNLLPFFGLYYLDNRLCLVSPWMENGGIVEFLRSAPADTDRPSLILDVAMGLEYLHSEHIIHADLKGSNILVTPSRRACIADFGLSSIADSMPAICFTHSTASTQRGTMRWQAPELLRGESVSNVSSDVYAFACVCYEVPLSPAYPMLAAKSDRPTDIVWENSILRGTRTRGDLQSRGRGSSASEASSVAGDCSLSQSLGTHARVLECTRSPTRSRGHCPEACWAADWSEKHSIWDRLGRDVKFEIPAFFARC
ncbi:kinase-like domain-containing protein [Mycena latifolia]|nr:kinase-like domain-containing protein [Mycena latifolia]